MPDKTLLQRLREQPKLLARDTAHSQGKGWPRKCTAQAAASQLPSTSARNSATAWRVLTAFHTALSLTARSLESSQIPTKHSKRQFAHDDVSSTRDPGATARHHHCVGYTGTLQSSTCHVTCSRARPAQRRPSQARLRQSRRSSGAHLLEGRRGRRAASATPASAALVCPPARRRCPVRARVVELLAQLPGRLRSVADRGSAFHTTRSMLALEHWVHRYLLSRTYSPLALLATGQCWQTAQDAQNFDNFRCGTWATKQNNVQEQRPRGKHLLARDGMVAARAPRAAEHGGPNQES